MGPYFQQGDVSAPSRFHDLVLKVIPYVLLPKIWRVRQQVSMITLKIVPRLTLLRLLADANAPTLGVAENVVSERPLPVSAEIEVRDLSTTEKFESYITGEEKIRRYYLCMKSSDSSQTLWSNAQQPMSTTELSLPSSSLFLDSRTRNAKF